MFERISSFFSKPQPEPRYVRKVRSFNAASYGNTLDFKETFNINNDIQAGLRAIRNRARALAKNDGYAESIITSLTTNIVGERGIAFSCQSKKDNGTLDVKDNKIVNDAWAIWGKYGNCTVDGQLDWVKVQQIVLETVITDGECLVLLRRGKRFGKRRFQLEILPPDQLDENYFDTLSNGNIVFQGVELDEYLRPQAYHVWKRDIFDPVQRLMQGNERVRIDAKDCLHIFDLNHPKQVRGISWLVTAILPLHHLSKLSQNELEMTRLATLKQVVYKMDAGADFTPGDKELDDMGMINDQITPGGVDFLPPGVTMDSVDWDSPNLHMPEFRKGKLREISAGVGISYNTIAKDLESVNYSSARFGALEDRVGYTLRQRWFTNVFVNRVYEEWLSVQLTANLLPFPEYRFDKFCDVKWTGKGWSSVDPLKDAKANELNLMSLLTTRAEIYSQSGADFQETVNAIVQEELAIKTAFESAGLPPPPPLWMQNVKPQPEQGVMNV